MSLSKTIMEMDLLIIGGGCAGTMAAIRAKEISPDLNIVIMEKGNIKRSGSVTMGMDALNTVVIPNVSTPEEYVEMLKTKCWGIVDEEPSYTLAKRSFEILKDLENWGVFFPKERYGNYHLMQVDEKGKFSVGMDEPNLKLILEKKIRNAGVHVLNKTMATKIVVFDNKVIGVVGLNIYTGQVIFCKAKSVILANGSAARFGLPNTGYLYGTFDFPGNAGDGFALAYRAGAKITGMEYTLKYPLVKDLNIPLIYITITRGAKVINYYSDIIMDENNLSIHRLIESLEKEKGPCFLKTDHLSKEKINEIENILFSTERPMQRRFWELKNIKLGRDLIELSLTEAQLCGGHGLSGVVINKFAETCIKGLFAAGDVSSVPMQHLTGAFVYGKIAAESAIEYCTIGKLIAPTTFIENQFDEEYKRLGAFMDQDNNMDYSLFEYKLRRIINEYLLSPKNEYSLNKGTNLIFELREQLSYQVGVKDFHQLGKVLELGYIIDCAQMSALASLTRKESRWGSIHKRTDYPDTDDKNWLKHIDLQIGENYPETIISFRDVQRGANSEQIFNFCR